MVYWRMRGDQDAMVGAANIGYAADIRGSGQKEEEAYNNGFDKCVVAHLETVGHFDHFVYEKSSMVPSDCIEVAQTPMAVHPDRRLRSSRNSSS